MYMFSLRGERLLLLYIINVLYKGLLDYNVKIEKSAIIEDSVYISELGYIKKESAIMTIHENLIKVVEKMNEYCVPYEEIILVLGKLLMNICHDWIIDRYNEVFYKYISLEKKEVALHITKNLLVNNELAMIV